MSSHILELDDIHKGSTLHAAAPVIPAALAFAEREHADGRAFLRAVVLGYEAALRIGEAVNPSHYRFWHPTGTAATFGRAAAAGSLLKLECRQQMLDALGSAGTQAAGLWEFNADGAMSKHLHPGKAAFNGLLAADLARAGFTGASAHPRRRSRILPRDERRRTIRRAHHRRPGRAMEDQRELLQAAFLLRPHAHRDRHARSTSACNASGPSIPASIEQVDDRDLRARLRDREGRRIRARRIRRSSAWLTLSPPALLEGSLGLEQFSRIALWRRTACATPRSRAAAAHSDQRYDDLTAQYPAAWPVRISVTYGDGHVEIREAATIPRGNPENPVTTAELERKFTCRVEPRFGDVHGAAGDRGGALALDIVP